MYLSEMGLVSKKILDKINTDIRTLTMVNQWQNSASVIEWFKNIPDKAQHTFIIFDIAKEIFKFWRVDGFYDFVDKRSSCFTSRLQWNAEGAELRGLFVCFGAGGGESAGAREWALFPCW